MKTFIRTVVAIATSAVAMLGIQVTSASATSGSGLQSGVHQTSGHLAGANSAAPALRISSPKPLDSTGQYTSFCTNLGVGYDWTGRDPSTCPGFLDVYISGQNVAHINTGGHGGTITWSCALGLGVSMVSIFVPGGLEIGWATLGTLSSLGITLVGCAGY